MNLDRIAGIAHRPDGTPEGVVVLTHGAGGNRDSPLLQQVCDEWAGAGGHSYGGRQTSMVVAAGDAAVDVLTLFSYPVHPPGKPERARTEHLPAITVPTVFTHGTSDPFGTPEELNAAAALVGGTTAVVEIASARHDLRSKTLNVAALAVDAALQLLGRN